MPIQLIEFSGGWVGQVGKQLGFEQGAFGIGQSKNGLNERINQLGIHGSVARGAVSILPYQIAQKFYGISILGLGWEKRASWGVRAVDQTAR